MLSSLSETVVSSSQSFRYSINHPESVNSRAELYTHLQQKKKSCQIGTNTLSSMSSHKGVWQSMALSLDGAKGFPFQLATQNQCINNVSTARYQTELPSLVPQRPPTVLHGSRGTDLSEFQQWVFPQIILKNVSSPNSRLSFPSFSFVPVCGAAIRNVKIKINC